MESNQLSMNEVTIYAFALRYASGRHTYAPYLVIDEIIKVLPRIDDNGLERILREITLRRSDARIGYNEWDKAGGEPEAFDKLEAAVMAERERRKEN